MRLFTVFTLSYFALSLSLFSQAPSGPGYPSPRAFHGRGGLMGPGMRAGKVIAGAPYSATTKDSVTQTLTDGNTISRVITGQVARDSQGRTYSQQNITGGFWGQGGVVAITFISDPVAGYNYMLNSTKKTAFRRPFTERTNESAPPFERSNAARNGVQTDLGQQTISGVVVTGKSVTRTIPAGQIGNAAAITEKTETWTDPQLQVVVQSTHSDPRWGQSTYSLTNIQQTEPNPALFQVPPGYTVTDAPSRGSQP